MQSQPKLKSCPKCRMPFGAVGYASNADKRWFGRCRACGFTAPAGSFEAEAVTNWQAATADQDQQGSFTMPA